MWADAKPDGTPPNNWLSTFGEVEWRWDTRRNPYFLHNFLTSQPDLNVQDPVGIEFWPDESGHNGCRTPMSWDSSVHGGFGTAVTTKPWLPVAPEHIELNAASQIDASESMRSFPRRVLAWRRTQPALQLGSLRLIGTSNPSVLGFVRALGAARLVCALNLSDEAASLDPRDLARSTAPSEMVDPGLGTPLPLSADEIRLAPWSAAVARLG